MKFNHSNKNYVGNTSIIYVELRLSGFLLLTCVLLDKVSAKPERLWYIQQTLAQGWSRNVLELQIETRLYQRKGKAQTNFPSTLPSLDSDLANEVLKDPYVFDFITTGEETKERNVQTALLTNIGRFLLELGVGFTFVGSNYRSTQK
jgi:predicted nuclease of restriction endonuclease-like (RecB) superfamily